MNLCALCLSAPPRETKHIPTILSKQKPRKESNHDNDA